MKGQKCKYCGNYTGMSAWSVCEDCDRNLKIIRRHKFNVVNNISQKIKRHEIDFKNRKGEWSKSIILKEVTRKIKCSLFSKKCQKVRLEILDKILEKL